MNSLIDMVAIKLPENPTEKRELMLTQRGKLVIVHHRGALDRLVYFGTLVRCTDYNYSVSTSGDSYLSYPGIIELMIDSSDSNNAKLLTEGKFIRL